MSTIRETVLSLDGIKDYLDCGAIDFARGAYTIEAWFRCEDQTEGELLTATINNDHGIILSVRSDGKIRFVHRNPPANTGPTDIQSDESNSLPVNDGQWHHVAAVSGTKMQIFIDGIEVKTGDRVSGFHSPMDVLISRLKPDKARNPFKGRLAEVRLWNVARTAEELSHSMHRTFAEPQPGLVGYWPLRGVLKDQSGHRNDAIRHGTEWVTDTTLPVYAESDPGALRFAGGDTYVDCGNPIVTTAITIEAWYKLDVMGNGVILEARGGLVKPSGFTCFVSYHGISIDLSQNYTQYHTDDDLSASVTNHIPDERNRPERHHLAITWSAASQTIRVYFDGVLQPKTATFIAPTLAFMSEPNAILTIGGVHDNPEAGFRGLITEVRLWGVERSYEDILATMNNRLTGNEDGLVGYWPLDRPGPTVAQLAGGVAAGRLPDGILHGSVLAELTPALQLAPPALPNAVLALDGTSQVVPDTSAAGQHGIRHGGVWIGVPDLPLLPAGQRHCLHLNGTSDFVDCGPGPFVSTTLTVEAWVKGSTGHIVNRGGSGESDGYALLIQDGKLRVELQNRKVKLKATVETAYPDDQWHHVAFTWQAHPGTITLYVDGVAKTTGDFTYPVRLPGQRLNIGRNASWPVENLFKGHISEVRIWNVARTDTQIAANKGRRLAGNEAGLAGYWPLDGVNEYAAAPVVSGSWTPPNPFTVELWVRRDQFQSGHQDLIFSSARRLVDGAFWIEVDDSSCKLFLGDRSFTIGNLNVNTWHHIAAAYDVASGALRTFLDGRETNTTTIMFQPVFHEYLVGGNFMDRRGFSGAIADLRVWKVALSARQIAANRNFRLTSGHTALAAYFPFNKGYGDSDLDKAGGALARLVGVAWRTDTTLDLKPPITDLDDPLDRKPLANAALALDGADDYIDCGSIDFAQGFYTIELWFRCGDQRGAELVTASIDNRHGIFLGIENGQIRFVHRNPPGSSGGASMKTDGPRIDDGQWHHCAAVQDGTLRLYIDGEAVNSSNNAIPFNGPLDVLISRLTPATVRQPFVGLLREVRLWGVARTANQIKATKDSRLWGSELGLVAYWPLDSGVFGQETAPDKAGNHPATLHVTTPDGKIWRNSPPLVLGPPATKMAPIPLNLPDTVNPALALTGRLPVPAVDQLSESHLPDWLQTLIREIRASTIDSSLTINASTLSNFDLFAGIGDWLFSALTISNIEMALLTEVSEAEEEDEEGGGDAREGGDDAGESGNDAGEGTDRSSEGANVAASGADTPGATGTAVAPADGTSSGTDADRHGSTRRRSRSRDASAGLSVSGDVAVLGLEAASVAVEFTAKTDDTKTAVVKIKGGGSGESKTITELLGGTLPDEVVTVLDMLGGSMMTAPSFAFATESVSDDEAPFDMGISEGFNFYGMLDLTRARQSPGASLGKLLGYVAGVFDLETLTIHVAINKTATGVDLEVNAAIEQSLTLINGSSFKVVYRGAVVSLAVSGSPPEPSLSLSNAIDLTFTFVGADDLRMTGTITVEPESISAAYTLQTYDESDPWHPFNYEKFSVEALALSFGGTYATPWIDNVGFAVQNARIGERTASLAIQVDANDPDAFAFVIDVPLITGLELISCYSPLTIAAWQALPDSVKSPLEEIVDVELSDVYVSIVPEATEIGELTFDDEGITVKGKLLAWGWQAQLKASISNSRVDIYAEMDPIRLGLNGINLFAIEGALGTPKPTFDLYLGTEEMPRFIMSVSVTLLALRTSVYAQANEQGLKFFIERALLNIGRVALNVQANSELVQAGGIIEFDLDLSIPIDPFGELQLLDVGFRANVDLRIDRNFRLGLTGSLWLYGQHVRVDLVINEPLPDFAAILSELIAYLRANATALFGAIWDSLEAWASAVADGVITFAGNVADVAVQLGEASVEAITAAGRIVGESAADIAAGLRDAGRYTADQVAAGLAASLNLGPTGVATAMNGAGYAVNEVGAALDNALDQPEHVIEEALLGANFAQEAVTDFVKQAFRFWTPSISIPGF